MVDWLLPLSVSFDANYYQYNDDDYDNYTYYETSYSTTAKRIIIIPAVTWKGWTISIIITAVMITILRYAVRITHLYINNKYKIKP